MVAIVGMACRFPDAPTPTRLWENILSRHASFQTLARQRWDHARFLGGPRETHATPCRMAALLDDPALFAARHFGISKRRAEAMDPQQRLVLEVVREVLQDAGLETMPFDRRRTATFVGAGVSEYSRLMVMQVRARQMAAGELGASWADAERLAERVIPTRAYTIPGSLLSMCASVVSQAFDLGGPAMAVDAACASSLAAVVHAVHYLRALPRTGGPSPVAIAGGVYLLLLPDNLVGFSRIGALGVDRCRPFDREAEGFLMGEGVGMIALKRLEDAERDGDRIYATIRGVAWNSDGRGESPMTPELEGQVELIRAGLADAGLSPADVDYVESHGTATTAGDEAELRALDRVFRGATRPVLGSVKANIGHTLSAAGIAGLMRAALAVHHAVLPPQTGWSGWPDALQAMGAKFEIPLEARAWTSDCRRATVSAFGFGGTNAFAVLEQPPRGRPSAPTVAARQGGDLEDGRGQGTRALAGPDPAARGGHRETPGALLFCPSAPTPALLRRYLEALARAPLDDLAAVAFTVSVARRFTGWGASIVADSAETLRAALAAAGHALASPPPVLTRTDPGVALGPIGEASPELEKTLSEEATAEAMLLAVGVARSGGQEVDLAALYPRRALATLPFVPLERDRYWAVAPGDAR
jgi:acyl transferase domain-containing protein